MPRPNKSGVDYFPLDVKMDDEVELIESVHSVTGFAVLVKVYQKIYSSGYWIKWDEKTVIVFSKRVNVDINKVIAIINSCLEWNLFDQELFDRFEILTSTGIQRRYFEITRRRTKIAIVNEFLLVNLPTDTKTTWVNVDINSINVCKSTQSKGKGKERESKVTSKETSNKFSDDSVEMKLSRYLYKVLQKSNPNQKEPNWQNWCSDFDRLIRINCASPSDIQKVINHAHDPANSTDKFSWIPNLRSPKKVREHFEKIFLQMKTFKPSDDDWIKELED